MARPWRAGGDGRSVSFPELPWKKEKTVPDQEHKTETHTQGRDEGLASMYYYACTCGHCGSLQSTRDEAVEQAQKHLDAARHRALVGSDAQI